MSLVLKNKIEQSNNLHWQPSASIQKLHLRANLLKQIRHFFSERNILEVETPLLCHTSVTDPFIQSIHAFVNTTSRDINRYYLQTSPEYAMKRLLAAGSGSIYQITKAFRQDEIGRHHNPEFTMLEWYRLGFDHHDLINEVDELLQLILKTKTANRYTYQALFQSKLSLDPFTATISELQNCAIQHQISVAAIIEDRDTWLQLLMSHCIEPQLGFDAPCFIYDFPASQSALARIQNTDPKVASRFEVYVQGIELANGFHELQDANEQRQRFEKNNTDRQSLNLQTVPLDEYFLASLEHGLPDCAGVALGIDRLIMLATHSNSIAEVISFDIQKA